jgi:O-6-methylguanine DNA methyltransferase
MKKAAAAPSLLALPIPTAEGEFIARYTATGLAELNFPKPLSPRSRGDDARISTGALCKSAADLQSAEASAAFSLNSADKMSAALCFTRPLPSSILHAPSSPVPPPVLRAWHQLTVAALQRVLAGRAAGKLPPLDWTGTTAFQQAVWREMLRLKPGQTRSYGELAKLIGRPLAVRAVGGACGANPIPVLVPCHRVLAANRKLGGFSGGLDWKRRLLTREGIVV